jgi:ribosomal protein S18 acetylase RimI-like enzyme
MAAVSPSSHPLDRPVWHALTTLQAPLAIAEGGLLRFDPAYALFAAARPGSTGDAADWITLARRTGRVALFEPDPVAPPGLAEVDRIDCQQMVCTRLEPGGRTVAFEPLDDADGPDMLALATLTRPGPFLEKTHLLGPFIGIRDGARLVAMAGERLNLDGFGEVSGVCTHPDYRGRGYAGALMRTVVGRILDRGATAFLHARSGHDATIAFYETLGFRRRSTPSYVVMAPVAGV